MFKGRSLSVKLYMGFGLVLFISTSLGLFAFERLVLIKKATDIITQDCLPGIFQIEQIGALARDNMQKSTRAVLADNPEEVEMEVAAIKANVVELEKSIKKYEATIILPEDREMFTAMQSRITAFRAGCGEVLALAKAGKMKEAEEILKKDCEPVFDKYMSSVDELIAFNKANGDEESERIERAVNASKSGILGGLILAFIVGGSIGIFLSRSISAALTRVIASLAEGSEQVSSASRQVSESSQQMAEGASEQASSLEETSASLEEMSSMTKQNSDNSREADRVATATREAVEKSRSTMDRMSQAIGQIKGSSDQTAKIVKTIDEIAFQTNLLALNAAVEAARAGDAGKGFAVVAEEVRNLAQRSAEAAKHTTALIEEAQKNADNGVLVSQEVAGILVQIGESVAKLGQLISEVSSANQEHSKGIGQIGEAVTQMDRLTQSNAASAEESASASEELSAQATELNEMVNVLVAIVTGSSAGGRFARAVPKAGPNSGRKPSPNGARKLPVSAANRPQADWKAVPKEVTVAVRG